MYNSCSKIPRGWDSYRNLVMTPWCLWVSNSRCCLYEWIRGWLCILILWNPTFWLLMMISFMWQIHISYQINWSKSSISNISSKVMILKACGIKLVWLNSLCKIECLRQRYTSEVKYKIHGCQAFFFTVNFRNTFLIFIRLHFYKFEVYCHG